MAKRKAMQSPLTPEQADELRVLHRKAMKACENHYQATEFSHRRMTALHRAEAEFLAVLRWLENGI